MHFSIFFHEKAVKELKKVDNSIRERIKKEIKELANNSEKGKHLHYCNFWSLRIGDYRAIYELKKEEKTIIILHIGHRDNVYEDLRKIMALNK